MDIKETKEFIGALGILGVAAKRIAKDGINASDIAEIVSLAQKFKELSEGFKGLDIMLEELKSLDQAEVLAIIGELYAQADAINKA